MFFSQQRKREKRFLKERERRLSNAKFDPEEHLARGKNVQFGFLNAAMKLKDAYFLEGKL